MNLFLEFLVFHMILGAWRWLKFLFLGTFRHRGGQVFWAINALLFLLLPYIMHH